MAYVYWEYLMVQLPPKTDGAVRVNLRFLLDTVKIRAQLILQPIMRLLDPDVAHLAALKALLTAL